MGCFCCWWGWHWVNFTSLISISIISGCVPSTIQPPLPQSIPLKAFSHSAMVYLRRALFFRSERNMAGKSTELSLYISIYLSIYLYIYIFGFIWPHLSMMFFHVFPHKKTMNKRPYSVSSGICHEEGPHAHIFLRPVS